MKEECRCRGHSYSRKGNLIFEGAGDISVSMPKYDEDVAIACLALAKRKRVRIECNEEVRCTILSHFGYCL